MMKKMVTLVLLGFLMLFADGPVLKTGQTTSYAAGDNGTYQVGIARSYTAGSGVVTDNATGLVWQDDAVGSQMNWASALTQCADLSLDGYDDWRLPTIGELKTLVDYSKTIFLINSTFLNLSNDNGYWTSTTIANNPLEAWFVDFYDGSDYWVNKSGSGYVRCVRGISTSATTYVRDNTTDTVYDSQTNLTWQDDASVSNQTRIWSNAIDYCENLTFAGVDDWRLPTINELYMIADRTRTNPAINPTFTHVASNYYWSSTTVANDLSRAWGTYFNAGYDNWDVKGTPGYVRCVRSGQLVTSSSSSSSSSLSSVSSSSSSESSSSISSSSSSIASSSSSESSSSSSIYINPNHVTASVQITEGWNLIAVPFNTDDEFDITSLIQNMATIGWKFKFITNNGDTYSWDKWEKGTTLKLKNGEGLFIGIPSTLLPRPSDYIQFQGLKTDTLLKFENKTYLQNKWYLLGFGYEVKMSDVLTHYSNATVWIMENGAYKKLTNTDTIKIGQGFWFKYN